MIKGDYVIHGTMTGRFKTSGAGNAMAKLTVKQVKFIKLAAYHGASYTLLARHFGVGRTQIYRIVHGIDWRQV